MIQLATRPFLKHIYRILRALLNLILKRNEIGSFKTQTIHKSVLLYKNRHVSIRNLTSPIQHKTCIHTQIPYKYSQFHTCDLLFSFPSFFFSLLFFFFFFFLSLLFSLIHFCSLFSKTKMRYLFWSYPYLILSPFYFTFQLKEETSSLFPSSHLSLPQFSSLFYSNIFLLLLFGPPILYYS